MTNKKAEQAKEHFLQGYNCAQAVLLAFKDETGLETETLLKLSSSFGSGLGMQREVCGAVSGVCMAAGIVYGYSDPKDHKNKVKHYGLIKNLSEKFKETNGSIVCKELLGFVPARSVLKKRPCADLVYEAAKIMAEHISKNKITAT